jgi:hypothetical protein
MSCALRLHFRGVVTLLFLSFSTFFFFNSLIKFQGPFLSTLDCTSDMHVLCFQLLVCNFRKYLWPSTYLSWRGLLSEPLSPSSRRTILEDFKLLLALVPGVDLA